MLYPNIFLHQRPLDAISYMLNRLFRKKFFDLSIMKSSQRRSDQPIEKESPINKQNKTQDLQPLERFPSKEERYNPDEQSSAGIDR